MQIIHPFAIEPRLYFVLLASHGTKCMEISLETSKSYPKIRIALPGREQKLRNHCYDIRSRGNHHQTMVTMISVSKLTLDLV